MVLCNGLVVLEGLPGSKAGGEFEGRLVTRSKEEITTRSDCLASFCRRHAAIPEKKR